MANDPAEAAMVEKIKRLERTAGKAALEKREFRKALAIVVPFISILLGCFVYLVYMHLIVVSTTMAGELVSSNHGFVQTTRGGFYVDGFLAIPEGRHLEIRKNRSGSESLCSIPFNEGTRPACVGVVKRVDN